MRIDFEDLLDRRYTIFKSLYDKDNDIAGVISSIEQEICALGEQLDLEKFQKVGENVWIAKSAIIDDSVKIIGPCIIDEKAEIRGNVYIRNNVVIGKNSVVGSGCELKNCILFDGVKVAHFNYVGDSILGYKVHLGAGAIVSNLKLDCSNIKVKLGSEKMAIGLRKMGAVIGDFSQIGCNSVLCPGTILYKNVSVYPLTRVRGVVRENSIVKADDVIVLKEEF